MSGVLTFGEALLKLALPATLRLEDLTRLEAQCAGAELNVAAALSALGRPSAWVGAVPPSPLGEWVRRQVRALGVQDLSLERPGRLGTFYLEDHHPPRPSRVVYDRAGSAFTRLEASDLDPGWLAGREALHLSGISLAVAPGSGRLATALMEAARSRDITVSFDVNHRRLLLPENQARVVYAPALALADLIFVAERDTALLGGLGGLRNLNPAALIVQTRGAAGSLALLPDGDTLTQPALAAQGPGRVGRGDAYAAGFLHARLGGADPQQALAYASACAALKTTTPGDQLLASSPEVQSVLNAPVHGEPLR